MIDYNERTQFDNICGLIIIFLTCLLGITLTYGF